MNEMSFEDVRKLFSATKSFIQDIDGYIWYNIYFLDNYVGQVLVNDNTYKYVKVEVENRLNEMARIIYNFRDILTIKSNLHESD